MAWGELPFAPAFYSEIDPAPIALLRHRHPGVPLWGDFSALRVRHLRRMGIAMPDVLVGGTPCQSFSFAGKRLSLADDRGNLALAFVRLAHAVDNARSREGRAGLSVLWENVPGVLSTDDNAFGCLLAGFVGADHPLRSPLERGRWPDAGMVAGPRARAAWRVLDAQYFGLAQRRERVFVVVSFRDGHDPAAVLFEPRGVHGNPAPRRKEGAGVARSIGASTGGPSAKEQQYTFVDGHNRPLNALDEFVQDVADPLITKEGETYTHEGSTFRTRNLMAFGGNNTVGAIDVATALRAKGGTGHGDFESETFIAFTCKDHGQDARVEQSPTLRAMNETDGHANAGGQVAIAFKPSHYTRGKDGAPSEIYPPPSADADKGDQDAVIAHGWMVRRLTPTECERLQGFPDFYTLVPYRGGMMKDGPRYRMLGNSMAVPVISWLGRRLVAQLEPQKDAA